MADSLLLGAYWPARREALADCAAHTRRFLTGLAQVDPVFERWYERGRSRSDALRRPVVPQDASAVEALLLRGRNRTDVGGQVIDELGFSVGLWNGASGDEEASVSIRCGAGSARVGNSVVLDLPSGSAVAHDAGRAASLLRLTIGIWSPAQAAIMSKKAMRERDFTASRPFVDWMFYVPGPVGPLPPPARVEPSGGTGLIVVVQPAAPQEDDPDQMRHVREVEALLIR